MAPSWRLRGYVLHDLLGSGGSGDVWSASVSDTREPVALKRVPIIGPAHLERVHAEAAILSALDHPHLVRLHAVVPDVDAVVLVLDLADSGTLADLLHARGRLTPGEVITALAPVAAALAYVHAAGVVHGDVSAANVLFTRGGVAMLSDLGVARLSGDERDAESTPAYVDPAVAAGCIPGPQSDVFMLGGLALHALTGSPPWEAADSASALDLARRGVIPDLESRLTDSGIDEEMARVVRRALAVLPHERGTAADFALELRHSGRPVAVELGAGRERPAPTPWAPHRSRPMFTGPSSRRAEPSDNGATHRPRHAAVPAAGPVAPAGSGPTGSGRSSLFRSAAVRRHAAAAADPARPTFDRPEPRALFDAGSGPDGGIHRDAGSGPELGMRGDARDQGEVDTRADAGSHPAARVPNRGPGGTAARPAGGRSAGEGSAPPTRAVSRPRPVLPTPRRRVRVGRPLAVVAVVLTVAVVAAGLVWWLGGDRATPSPAAAVRTTSGRASLTPDRDALPTDWAPALAALDAARARAYARGDNRLLTRVYPQGALMRSDATTLRRLVPRGCGLLGARTRYGNLQARRRGDRVALVAEATLMPSRLVCHGRVIRHARGAGPTLLRITLIRTPAGLRIAEQSVG